MVGYDGPIYMTHPTKAICPILLVRLVSLKQAFSNPSVAKSNLAPQGSVLGPLFLIFL